MMAMHLDANATMQAVDAVQQAVRLGDILIPAMIAAGFGLVMWFLRENFAGLRMDIRDMKKSHQECQVALARDYATRDEVAKVWNRVDEHTADIATIKGALGME